MTKKNSYIQCTMERKGITEVAWIPSSFAKEGKIIKLKQNEIWVDGWKVKEVGLKKLPFEDQKITFKEYGQHREVTDK